MWHRRLLTVLLAFYLVCFGHTLQAQVPASGVAADLNAALAGRWVGVLEYRDYKEPATSLKRVVLPTWLMIDAAGTTQVWKYTYDDGPGKVVEERDVVVFDAAAKTYSSATNGKAATSFAVAGYDELKAGRGVLVLLGATADNNKPSEMRVTITVRRNLLETLEEVRPAGSTDAFAFRHAYRFVRAEALAVK